MRTTSLSGRFVLEGFPLLDLSTVGIVEGRKQEWASLAFGEMRRRQEPLESRGDVPRALHLQPPNRGPLKPRPCTVSSLK